MRVGASRTFFTAGNKRPMSTAMMAITTSNSITVQAGRLRNMTTYLPKRDSTTVQEKESLPQRARARQRSRHARVGSRGCSGHEWHLMPAINLFHRVRHSQSVGDRVATLV